MRSRRAEGIAALLVLLAGTYGTALSQSPVPVGRASSELVVRVLDVGQGDAVYIENGSSKIIIDGGPSAARFGQLLDSLEINNTTIDVVILSHAHLDHYSGLRELFRTSRNITINYFFENRDVGAAVTLARLRDSINARVDRGQLIVRDTDDPCLNGSPICTITMAGGATLHVLRPNPAGTKANNRSTAVKLLGPDSASFTMWLAGDAERREISWFLGAAGYSTNPGMQVNVLKSDHHGSCNGVTNAYADAINPDLQIVSVGARNGFGHMHEQTKRLWRGRSKPWYRTDQNGTITLRTPGTVGGGYAVTVGKGVASMNGAPDATSAQAQCRPIP
jgi:competence protein ComEC